MPLCIQQRLGMFWVRTQVSSPSTGTAKQRGLFESCPFRVFLDQCTQFTVLKMRSINYPQIIKTYIRNFSVRMYHLRGEQAFCVPEDGTLSIMPNQVLLCLKKKPSGKRV